MIQDNKYENALSIISDKIKNKITECKELYKIKLENQFTFKDMKGMWKSLKEMSGCVPEKKCINVDTDSSYVNDLNSFYCRFDTFDSSQARHDLELSLNEKLSESDTIEIPMYKVLIQFMIIRII